MIILLLLILLAVLAVLILANAISGHVYAIRFGEEAVKENEHV